jgi:two-component system sensor histidine kinase UhpB
VTGVSVFCRDVTDRKRAEAERRALPERIMGAQERERRHLARELHDGAIQDLASLKLHLSGLQALPEEQRQRLLEETNRRLDAVIAGLRDLSTRLRPSTLDDLGLIPAIRSYVSHRAEETGIEAFVSVDLTDARLAPELETNCFRIVQEAVGNALAHAAPRRLFVRVAREGAEIALSVRDDGSGFAPDERRREAARAGHFGLAVMEERAAALGGRIEIHSAPGAGTEIVAHLPCPEPESAGPS